MLYNQDQIKSFLPHRNPFLFVDEVYEIKLSDDAEKLAAKDRKVTDLIGGIVIAKSKVYKTHPIFQGHFPGNPILPGVVQVETIAQASSFLFTKLKTEPIGSYAVDVALLGIEKARFKIVIQPDSELRIETKMIRMRNWLVVFEGSLFQGDQLCSYCEFMARIDFK